jgi:hypothetical protein
MRGAGGLASTMSLKTDRGITLVDNDLVFTTQTSSSRSQGCGRSGS